MPRTSEPPTLTGWRDLPLARAALVRRYKRFLADVRHPDGRVETVHCPNSGSMLGMDAPGLPVVVSDSNDPKRRLRRTLELVQVDDGAGRAWVGVNTMRPNRWAAEAVRLGLLPGIAPGAAMRREVPFAADGVAGRLDLRLEPADGPPVWVEVKNTTLAERADDGALEACFPDAVTARGTRHLRALQAATARGERAMILFLVNRGDTTRFRAAATIDPTYAHALNAARRAGVEAVALQVGHRVRRTARGLSVTTRALGRLPLAGQS